MCDVLSGSDGAEHGDCPSRPAGPPEGRPNASAAFFRFGANRASPADDASKRYGPRKPECSVAHEHELQTEGTGPTKHGLVLLEERTKPGVRRSALATRTQPAFVPCRKSVMSRPTRKLWAWLVVLAIATATAGIAASLAGSASAATSAQAGWPGWSELSKIVVLSPTDQYLDRAASDLKLHLEKASGRTWTVSYADVSGPAIRLVVDAAPLNSRLVPPVKDIAPLIQTGAFGVRISSRTSLGVQNGAYVLLEKLGFKWLGIHPAWDIAPQALSVISIDQVFDPSFIERTLGIPVGDVVPIPGAPAQLSAWKSSNMLSVDGRYTLSHSWPSFADKASVAAQDPTAACYVPGTTIVKQVLPSHPVVINRALDYMRKRLATAAPLLEVVPISPPDGNTIWCAEWVTATGGMDRAKVTNEAFGLVDEVARRAAVEYPGKLIGIHSYSNYSDVPSIPLEPNVFVNVTTFARGRQTLSERIAGFQAKGVRMGFRDYTDVWPWWKDRIQPPGKINKLIENIPVAADAGMDSWNGEASANFGSTGRLYWIMSQMMWDASRDPSALNETYIRSAFGPAYGPMSSFYGRFDTRAHSEEVFGMAFRDLAEALEIAIASGDTNLRDRVLQTIYHTYFWWRWQKPIMSSHSGFSSVQDAKDLYAFLWRVRDFNIVLFVEQELATRATLGMLGVTADEITALKNSLPYSTQEGIEILSRALNNWKDKTLQDDPHIMSSYAFDSVTAGTTPDATLRSPAAIVNGPAIVPGKRVTALQFDGDNDQLKLPQAALNGKADFSISVWLKTTTRGQIIASAVDSTGTVKLQIGLGPSGALRIMLGDIPNSEFNIPALALSDGNWHHLIVTRDAANDISNVYIDSVLNVSFSLRFDNLGINLTSAGVLVGEVMVPAVSTMTDYSGLLDELSIYSGALTASEAWLVYQGLPISEGRKYPAVPATVPTATATATSTATAFPTPAPLPTTMPTTAPTATKTPQSTVAPTATQTPIVEPEPLPSATSTPVVVGAPGDEPTATPEPTATATPYAEADLLPTATPYSVPTSTPEVEPTAVPQPTATSTCKRRSETVPLRRPVWPPVAVQKWTTLGFHRRRRLCAPREGRGYCCWRPRCVD